MTFTVTQGCISENDCIEYANGLSGITGWTLNDHSITTEAPPFVNFESPSFVTDQNLGPPECVICFKKAVNKYEGGYHLLTIVEGQLSVQCNGRKTLVCPGDQLWTNMTTELTCAGRFSRWIYVVQSSNHVSGTMNSFALFAAMTGSALGLADPEDDDVEDDVEDKSDEDDLDDDLEETDLDYGIDVDVITLKIDTKPEHTTVDVEDVIPDIDVGVDDDIDVEDVVKDTA